MPKQQKDTSHLEAPNYEALTTLEQVDEEIEKHKARLVAKDITEYRIKDDKKTYVSAINETLKELKEEREHEITVISALEQHKQLLANQGGQIIPLPVAKN